MITTGQFCTVMTSDYVQYNIRRGDVVYIAGDAMRPVDDDDPYSYRKFFIIARLVDDVVQSELGAFMVEGNNLLGVGQGKQDKLQAIHEEAYAEEN